MTGILKMKINTIIKLIAISALALSTQGCIVTAIGAGVGAVMYGKSKEKQADNECKASYTKYVDVMNKTKQPQMTLKQYCGK